LNKIKKGFPAGLIVRRSSDYTVEDYNALTEVLNQRTRPKGYLLDLKLKTIAQTSGLPDFLALKETKLASLLLNIEAPEADQLDATSLREIGASLSNQVTEEERNLDNVLGMIEKEKMLRFLTSIFWISLVVAAFISAVLLSFHLAKVRLGLE
jgi:hypothetical protein